VDATVIGLRIKDLRIGASLSQRDLANETGISQTNISRIEAGGRKVRIDEVVSLSWALGCPVETILEENSIRDRVLCATRANLSSADVNRVKDDLIFLLEMDAHLASHGIG
jgi:transcriptional regulator with XRE-family HTH domain